jgi:hypothetical protein
MEKGWAELHAGSRWRVPRFYYGVMKYVTPALILALLAWWTVDGMWATLTMESVPVENKPYVLATRVGLLLAGAALAWAVRVAWKRNHGGTGESAT